MNKAKKSLDKKEKRRRNEVLKAQSSVRGYSSVSTDDVKNLTSTVPATVAKISSFALPIAEIKKDLVKTAAFAVLSLVMIGVLSKTGFGVEYFSQFVKF